VGGRYGRVAVAVAVVVAVEVGLRWGRNLNIQVYLHFSIRVARTVQI